MKIPPKLSKFFKKNRIFLIVIGVILLVEVFSILFYGGGIERISSLFHKTNTSITGIILFVGDDCAQCAKVDTFIKDNKIESKVAFTRLEVFNNMYNADILADKAQTCGLNPSQIGVPFLWDGAHCILGYVDVINFFKSKLPKK